MCLSCKLPMYVQSQPLKISLSLLCDITKITKKILLKIQGKSTVLTAGQLDVFTFQDTLIVAIGRLWLFDLNISDPWVFLFTEFSVVSVHLYLCTFTCPPSISLMKVDRGHRKFSGQKIYRSDIFKSTKHFNIFKPFFNDQGKPWVFFFSWVLH